MLLLCLVSVNSAKAASEPDASPAPRHGSIADTQIDWPSRENIARVLLLKDYNTRVVLLGTVLLGISAGSIGTFMLLRKQSLIGDVVSHASLPGIAIAFIVMEMASPGSGKWLPGLLLGAVVAGSIGVLSTIAVRRLTRIKEDAALAIVLSIFFGLGIALFTIVQNIPTGNSAGLHSFIFGKAASIVAADVTLIGWASAGVLLVCVLFFKEFGVLCFDESYSATQGWPVLRLDLLLMAMVVTVTVIGLQSVGLLLVVALLIIPAAAARFWTDHLPRMTVMAATLGGLSALFGVLASALMPRLAAGAVIVLVGFGFFLISMFFGTRRGVVRRILIHRRLQHRIGLDDLARALFEILEATADGPADLESPAISARPVSIAQLLARRSWSPQRLHRLLRSGGKQSLIEPVDPDQYRLTEKGAVEARRAVRNHRLWELYLIHYADIAPSHVDRGADQIEHVIGTDLIDTLEGLLSSQYPETTVPPSPHGLDDE